MIRLFRMTNIATPIVGVLPNDAAEETFLGPLLKRAFRAASKVLRHQLEPLRLTPVQFAALRELFKCDGLSLGEVARRQKADPPTVSGVVDGLVHAGFVERREDPCDRRKLRLYLTDHAHAIEQELAYIERRREALLVQSLTVGEVQSLKELLHRLCENAETCPVSE